MTLLSMCKVEKAFLGVKALDGVSLDVPEGVVFGLIGPNGAGKTTLVNVISGYLRPDKGTITFRGRDIVGLKPHRLAAIGLARTYQNLRLFEHSTVLENVLIGRHQRYSANPWEALIRRRFDRSQRSSAVDLLERVGMEQHRDVDVGELPYGLRRRVEIARALATEPSLLLMDEPAAGMTRAEGDEIGRLMTAIRDQGVTVFLVEHNVRLVTEVCDEVAVLDWGRRIAQGQPEAVWADPEVRTAYLGNRREKADR